MKDKGFWVTFIIYIILMLGDFITTFMNEHWRILEVNPIYQATGKMWPILLINIGLLGVFYYCYRGAKAKPTMRFAMMNAMIIVILGRVFAIRNAIHHLLNPITENQALERLAVEQVTQQTTILLGFIMYLPLFITLITYFMWKLDHNVEKK